MTTATLTYDRTAGTGRLTFPRVLRSEWIKLRSLRSTLWSFAIVIAVSVGLAVLLGLGIPAADGVVPAAAQASVVREASLFGVFFGQLVIAVLGVLVISGEYSTGMIRSTLTAVPRRLPALWAKAAVLLVSSFVVGVVASTAAFLAASPILASKGFHASLFENDMILHILGGALYLAIVSVFALGLGAILRASAGGIAAALGAILLLPIVFTIAPLQWMHDTAPYLMMNAGLSSFGLSGFGGASTLETWQQILVVVGWAVVSLVAGAILLKRRDA
ncbi:ABC transporter permease subunit [Diaminobutyricibacter sp. McL0608]|uniref:ABC transporter permease subunit n=1 Tax=Leifsonia sp. McL0608 TaxID=3143537 RepID=UPI0031F3218E